MNNTTTVTTTTTTAALDALAGVTPKHLALAAIAPALANAVAADRAFDDAQAYANRICSAYASCYNKPSTVGDAVDAERTARAARELARDAVEACLDAAVLVGANVVSLRNRVAGEATLARADRVELETRVDMGQSVRYVVIGNSAYELTF